MKTIVALLCAMLLAVSAPILAAEKGAKAEAKPAAAQTRPDDKIDINRAKAEVLMKLDGIGDARAKAIIKGRPYKGKDDLVARNILSQAVYDKIADQIIAKQK